MPDLRSQFLLDPAITFLNHGSFGACPRPVFDEYQHWQRVLETQPVKLLGRDVDGLLREAMQPLAGILHADPEDCVFVANATTGVNLVARSLRLRPGDEILTTDHEYGACDFTWEHVCAETGAVIRRVTLPRPLDQDEDFIETVWSGVTPRTRVLFLSHITSPTALVFPLDELIRRARAASILSVIDGAHAPGQITLDLAALDPDFYTGNFHKWLCAPKTSAFLYARREHQPMLIPPIISWGWTETRFAARMERQATREPAAFLATPAALAFQQAHAWDKERVRCHALAAQAWNEMHALTGTERLCAHERWFAQMAAVELPFGEDRMSAIKTRLYDRHHIEIPITLQGGRIYIRVSFQAYNDERDLEVLLSGLKETLAYVG